MWHHPHWKLCVLGLVLPMCTLNIRCGWWIESDYFWMCSVCDIFSTPCFMCVTITMWLKAEHLSSAKKLQNGKDFFAVWAGWWELSLVLNPQQQRPFPPACRQGYCCISSQKVTHLHELPHAICVNQTLRCGPMWTLPSPLQYHYW